MMDEIDEVEIVTVGQRLREAREAQGLSIEDVAATTRIPTRHLASLEIGDWDRLPASTYLIGFAKNYATAVGLDKAEIAEQLRGEMGGERPVAPNMEVYEAADPARTMPKGLVFGALGLVLVAVLLFTWLGNRSMDSDPAAPPIENELEPVGNLVTAPAAAAGTVVLTANEAVWIEVKDGSAILKQGELAAGQSYEVPANAVAPRLTTGKPEALRIAIGTADAPAIGPAGERVSGVSLLAADLMKGPAASSPPAPAPAAAAPAPPRPAPRHTAPRRTAPATPPPATEPDNSAAVTPPTE
ncbi:MAG: helix-turn-helix domain-containing protein [Sphingomicrobium sp.]